MDTQREFQLVGAAIVAAQRFESTLYGLAAHLSHLPEAQKDRRFRELTPEKFLRGDVEDLRATLGQIEAAFGGVLMLTTKELKQFIRDRNTIAHNYWRLTKTKINGADRLEDPEKFLCGFIERSLKWANISDGLLYSFMIAAAKKENRLGELSLTQEQLSCVKAYSEHAAVRDRREG